MRKARPNKYWCAWGRTVWRKCTGGPGPADPKHLLMGLRKAVPLGYPDRACEIVGEHMSDSECWRLLKALPGPPASHRLIDLIAMTQRMPLPEFKNLWGRVVSPNPFGSK